jgi:hypothetical protein
MKTVVALGVSGVLVMASLLHVYWAMGGQMGKWAAVPEIRGLPAFTPSAGTTGAVAVALFAAAVVVSAHSGWLLIPIPENTLSALVYSLAFAFLARAIGEFRLVGFFKRVRGTTFAQLDSLVYSPLCLVMAGALFFVGCGRL